VIGGISNDVISLAYYLKDDFDIKILYGDKEKGEKEATYLLEQYPGVVTKKIHSLKKNINLVNDARAYHAIYSEIKKFNCHIVHTHGSKSGFLGRLAAYRNNVPCIIHTFHGHVFHSYYNSVFSKWIVKFERLIGRLTTHVIAISEQQGKELLHTYKIIPEKKLSVISLGIDKKHFSEYDTYPAESLRKKFTLTANTVIIGILGRIVAVKNFDLFIDVAEKVLSSVHKPIKFFIIGDGDLKEKVQRNLNMRNLKWSDSNNYKTDSQIIFTSWIPSVATAINDLDIIMLTSSNEGTPLSLIEAQFCGKPVIATDAGGVRDTFINNETGFLIPPGNADEFASKLSLLIEDDAMRDCMGKKAANFAAMHFAKNTEVEKVKQLYSNCVLKN